MDYGNPPPSNGMPGGFIFLFVILALTGVGLWAWKIFVATSAANELGVKSSTSTMLALTDPDSAAASMAAAAALQRKQQAEQKPTDQPQLLTERLKDLDEALQAGRLTTSEYDKLRQRLLDEF